MGHTVTRAARAAGPSDLPFAKTVVAAVNSPTLVLQHKFFIKYLLFIQKSIQPTLDCNLESNVEFFPAK